MKSLRQLKSKSDHSKEPLIINNQQIKTIPSKELQGIQLDGRLNFNNNVNSSFSPATNQFNALIKLERNLNFSSKKVLINSHVVLTLNYCHWYRYFRILSVCTKLKVFIKQRLIFYITIIHFQKFYF